MNMKTDRITRDQMLKFYRKMLLIRRSEEMIGEMVAANEVICPTHLCIGQEAVAVGVCSNLRDDDYVFSTHRAHGHFLAKGGSVKSLFAEVYGRNEGCSGGRGGSMHLVCPEKGILGTSSIVGGCLPIGVGAGLSAVMQQEDKISVIFFGDAAMDEGVFFEALNFASLEKLPVVFVCENNYYGTHMQICRRLPCNNDNKGPMVCSCGLLAKRVEPFLVPTEVIDGYDVREVYKAAGKAVMRARSGKGPSFIEAVTYRWRGHVGPNWDVDMGLRSKEEIDSWIKRCPINKLKSLLQDEFMVESAELEEEEVSIVDEVNQAIKCARNCKYPQSSTLLDNVYSD